MYLDHFGLKEPPFRITPDTDFFFQGANRGATLEALLYAITHDEGIVKVSGEVGSGKTMLCRVLMERLPATVETIYLANPSLSRDEILLAIGDELKLELEKGQTTRILRALQEHLIRLFGEGRRVVVLIDEAHAMPDETLEEIRLLSNLESNRHKLLQLVRFGQPEFDEHLDAAGMRQLRERITHSFRLEPLVRSDIENYIDFRMRAAGYRGPKIFNRRAIKVISSASQGLTRRVNILSDKACSRPSHPAPMRSPRLRQKGPCATPSFIERGPACRRSGSARLRSPQALCSDGEHTWSFRPVDRPSRPSPHQPRRARQLNPPLGPRKRRCPLFRACLRPRARTRRDSNEAWKP